MNNFSSDVPKFCYIFFLNYQGDQAIEGKKGMDWSKSGKVLHNRVLFLYVIYLKHIYAFSINVLEVAHKLKQDKVILKNPVLN